MLKDVFMVSRGVRITGPIETMIDARFGPMFCHFLPTFWTRAAAEGYIALHAPGAHIMEMSLEILNPEEVPDGV